MAFLNASTSFTRYRIIDTVPSSFWNDLRELLRKNSIQDIDELPEERSFGWVAAEDMLDTNFNEHPLEKGEYVTFALRLDTRRIPSGVIKKHLAIALKAEERANREQGKKFISKDRRKELKEQVELRLRMRFLPVPAVFSVVWNTASNMVYFASTQEKMLDLFEELFIRSFNLHLEALTPYTLGTTLLPDASALDRIEATHFV